jgi:uracil-DNA glycosylase
MPKIEALSSPGGGGKTPFAFHVEKWRDGCGGDSCHASKRVYCRGSLPCDVLFVGEAPGESENIIGTPFVGPAGKLLDSIVSTSFGPENRSRLESGLQPLTWAMTNMVCCRPRVLPYATDFSGDREATKKVVEPSAESIEACSPRLQEMVDLARPRLVVCVGTIARDWLAPGFKNHVSTRDAAVIDIAHPSSILRANLAQKGLMVQRCVVAVASALEDLR